MRLKSEEEKKKCAVRVYILYLYDRFMILFREVLNCVQKHPKFFYQEPGNRRVFIIIYSHNINFFYYYYY